MTWNKETTALTFTGTGVSATVTPAAQSALSNKSPYSLTISDKDYYTVDVNAEAEVTITVATGTESKKFRAVIFGLNAVNE